MYDPSAIFKEALYDSRSTTLKKFLDLYIALLKKENTEYSVAHAARLKFYNDDEVMRNDFFNYFNSLYIFISKNFPQLNFSLSGRKKAFLKTDSKIVKKLNDGNLKSPTDIYGFRLILHHESSYDLLCYCYDIMNKICKENELHDATLQEMGHFEIDECTISNIMVPSKTYIHPLYLKGVKDYILYPKENGYQSLHATFNSKNLGFFEIQIRTLEMDKHTDIGEAHHDVYDAKKYQNPIIFDRSQTHLIGYSSKNNILEDGIGFECPLEVYTAKNY